MSLPKLTVQQLLTPHGPTIKTFKAQAQTFCLPGNHLLEKEEYTTKASKAYWVKSGSEVVAYFTLRTELYFGHLTEFYLLPKFFREEGLEPLVNKIKEVALKEKFDYLMVWSSHETNLMYEQLGGQLSRVWNKEFLGQPTTEYYLTVVGEPWVDLQTAGLVCLDGDKLLLAFSKNKQAWYLPGGKIDSDEDSKQALIREIEEELSLCLQPDRLSFLTPIVAPAFGEKKNIMMQQACYYYELKGETITVANEIGGVQYFTKEEYLQHQIPVPGVLKVFEFLAESFG